MTFLSCNVLNKRQWIECKKIWNNKQL